MITQLNVSNFALIDDLDIVFKDGLSALTGETGAGKSIFLESLALLFGKRSDSQMIRHGHDQTIVKGQFKLDKKHQEALGLPSNIEVMRAIDQSGRHVIRLNGEVITLMRLKEIMSQIGSIHSQNETMMLYDRQAYLEFIDQVDQYQTTPLLNQYLIDKSSYQAAQKHLAEMKAKKHQSLEKQAFLEFQIKELTALKLKKGEYESLNEQIEKLKNFEKIRFNLSEAYQLIDEESHAIDNIHQSAKAMEKIRHLDPVFEAQQERLLATYYELDDIKSIFFFLSHHWTSTKTHLT